MVPTAPEAAAAIPLVEASARGATGAVAAARRPTVLAFAASELKAMAEAATRAGAGRAARRSIARVVISAADTELALTPAREATRVAAAVAYAFSGSSVA